MQQTAQASLAFYQLIFGTGGVLLLAGIYLWRNAYSRKDINGERRGRLLTLFAVIILVSTAVVSLLITKHWPL
ncbi:MAG: hypothetical protein SFU87_18775 [Chitinophagaceae bacterium]|nr:hypothetical protein [Chitinophagaceae bacterium]